MFEGEQTLGNILKSVRKRILIPTARIDIFTIDMEKHLNPSSYLDYIFEKRLNIENRENNEK